MVGNKEHRDSQRTAELHRDFLMTIEQIDKIDIIGISKSNGYVCLTISDHLEWDEKNKKLIVLQDKINSYLMFTESGQIFEEYPESIDKIICIELYCKYEPNIEGEKFLKCVKAVIEDAGFKFSWRVADS